MGLLIVSSGHNQCELALLEGHVLLAVTVTIEEAKSTVEKRYHRPGDTSKDQDE